MSTISHIFDQKKRFTRFSQKGLGKSHKGKMAYEKWGIGLPAAAQRWRRKVPTGFAHSPSNQERRRGGGAGERRGKKMSKTSKKKQEKKSRECSYRHGDGGKFSSKVSLLF